MLGFFQLCETSMNHRFVLLLACAVCWLWLVSGMWLGLLNIRWLDPALAVEAMVLATVVVIAGRIWILYPDWRVAITASVVVALILKAALVAWAVRGLLRQKLVRVPTLAVSGIAWVTLALTVAGLVSAITGGGAILFATVLLLLPLASALAAPLALEWARHR